MTLQYLLRRLIVSKKIIGALFVVLALAIQPFVGLNVPSAFAATIPISPTSHTVNGLQTKVSNANASGFSGMSVSFSHDAGKLEASETLVYGWRNGVAGADNDLGTINGQNGSSGAGEVGSKTVSLPDSAAVSNLVVYFKNTGAQPAASDEVFITSLSLSGNMIEENKVCASGCEYTNLAAAVAGEAAGQTITIKSGTILNTTSTININKQLTITGETGAGITTSGTNQVLVITAAGVVVSNLNFTKTDAATQNMIGIQAPNAAIQNNAFSGTYTLGGAQVSRALVVSTTSGVSIIGNTFNNLRQPAYINNGATGSITNNYVNQTRGWVIEKASDFAISGNTWGTNAVDIAIIPGVDPANTANNYSCRITQIKADNANAVVEDQYPGYCAITPGPTANYVINDSTTSSENDPKKWFFNRDPSTASPYVMSGAQASTSIGSLYAQPVSTTPADKFIAEYFVAENLDDTGAISFDYRLGSGGPANKSDFVYANLYVNVTDNGNFGNCVYTIVASDASAGWHTLSIDLNTAADSVRTRAGSPQTCPAKPSDLPSSAYLRALSLNVGDTTASDAGVNAYLDNVRVETVEETSVYDFEPIPPAAPTDLRWSVDGDEVGCNASTNNDIATARWDAVSGADSYVYGVREPGSSDWVEESVATNSASQTLTEDGDWEFRVASVKNDTRSSWSDACMITVDTTEPTLTVFEAVENEDGTVTFSGTSSEDGEVTITVDGDELVTVPVNSDGTWSYTTSSPVEPGSYIVGFEATDEAGNSSDEQLFLLIVVDTTPGTTTPDPGTTITTGVPRPISPLASASSTPVAAFNQANDSDDNGDDQGEVLGTVGDTPESDATVTPSTEGWKIAGIAWYWYLLALALVAGGWWGLAAWRRHREADADIEL